MDYTKEQRLEAYKKLPEAVKDILANLDSVEIIKKIGDKHSLHVDQLGILTNEIGLAMLGLVPTQEFTTRIINNIRLTAEQASLITSELNQEIFLKLREAVKQASSGEQIEISSPVVKKDISQQKIGQVFNLTADKPPKPWDNDPYLQKP